MAPAPPPMVFAPPPPPPPPPSQPLVKPLNIFITPKAKPIPAPTPSKPVFSKPVISLQDIF